MFRPCVMVTTLLATMLLSTHATLGQRLSDTAYGKRVLSFRKLEREILDKQIEAEGMLRVAGELQRNKPRSRTEAQMIVPRYDDFTKTLANARQHDAEVMTAIATLTGSADVTAARQKLEIAKRSMELRFKQQQAANTQLRKSKRRRGSKANANRQLQSVIADQKKAKQAYDETLRVITEQLKVLRGIEFDGALGGDRDTVGAQLHSTMTNFTHVVLPQREKGRVWIEKQADYALLNSTERRVIMRDDYRRQAAELQLEVEQLIDKAANLVHGTATADDLQQLASLVQELAVNPTAAARIKLTAPRSDTVSHPPYKSLTVLRQRMTFSGNAGNMELDATLSPSLTLEEIHAPQWALKFKDRYPFVHSGGVLSMWVGQFHITITPAAPQISPVNRTDILQWIEHTLKLDDLAAL